MHVAKKKVVAHKAKKAVKTTSLSKKINSTTEYKNTSKACRHFLKQVTIFNGLVAKLTKAKLGDKRYIVNVNRAFDKMSKLWAQYGKVSEKLHHAEKMAEQKSVASKTVKKAAPKAKAKTSTVKKAVKAVKKAAPKAKISTAKKPVMKKKVKTTPVKTSKVVKLHKKVKHSETKSE